MPVIFGIAREGAAFLSDRRPAVPMTVVESHIPKARIFQQGIQFLALIVLRVGGVELVKNDVLSLSRKVVKIIDKKGLDFLPSDIDEINGIGKAKAFRWYRGSSGSSHQMSDVWSWRHNFR